MTRILLVSDIHANLAALDAVLRDAAEPGFEAVWSMGDTVGYGPQPSECMLRLEELDALAVAGNHDLAALGKISAEEFNPYAKAAVEWTATALTDGAREYALGLPLRQFAGDFTLVHGSPRDPVWEYITDARTAEECLSDLATGNCAFGHTHAPAAMLVGDGASATGAVTPGRETSLGARSGRWFVNPGSVGQPRDRDPRASYAILDDENRMLSFHRVQYDIALTQRLIEDAGLPTILAERLSYGM